MNTLHKPSIGFTQVPNSIINDTNISFKEKGLYTFLMSKPESWQFSATRIAQQTKDGRDSVLKTMKKLEDCGYIERKKLPNGRIEHHLKFGCVDPKTESPTVGKSHRGEVRLISNNDTSSNKDTCNLATDVAGTETQEILNAFYEINPHLNYGNKTERKAAERLVKVHGKESVLKAVAILPKLNAEQYCPTTVTPYQLVNNWAKLKAFLEKKQNKKGRTITVL